MSFDDLPQNVGDALWERVAALWESRPLLNIKCFIDHEQDDISLDEDGHSISASLTYEPGGHDVYTVIEPTIPPAEVAKILRKMADWVEDGLMAPASLEEMKMSLEDNERRKRERSNREAIQDSAYEIREPRAH